MTAKVKRSDGEHETIHRGKVFINAVLDVPYAGYYRCIFFGPTTVIANGCVLDRCILNGPLVCLPAGRYPL